MNLEPAILLIKAFEGFRRHAYPDPVTGGKPYTIGYGQTGFYVDKDTVWSLPRAEMSLAVAVDRLAATITRSFPSFDLSANQMAAMISFSYNLGFATLLKVIHEVGIKGFPDKILEYDKAADHEIAGLKTRREAERALFLKECN